MDVVEARITTLGRVGFASREIGRLADTEEYILNTALHYALGLASGRYADTEFRPTYIEDTAEVVDEVYVTPAAPLARPEYSAAIYNARDDTYATVNYSAEDDPQQDLNLPRFGRDRKFSQDNEFRFYLIPKTVDTDDLLDKLPRYARLGKKRGKIRIDYTKRRVRRESGEFTATHPFGIYDYGRVPIGNTVSKRMRPTPLILQATYDAEHLVIPTNDQGNPTKLPTDLQFLKTKR